MLYISPPSPRDGERWRALEARAAASSASVPSPTLSTLCAPAAPVGYTAHLESPHHPAVVGHIPMATHSLPFTEPQLSAPSPFAAPEGSPTQSCVCEHVTACTVCHVRQYVWGRPRGGPAMVVRTACFVNCATWMLVSCNVQPRGR